MTDYIHRTFTIEIALAPEDGPERTESIDVNIEQLLWQFEGDLTQYIIDVEAPQHEWRYVTVTED